LMVDDVSQCIEMWREGREFMAYEALSQSPLDAVFDNLMDGSAQITSKQGWKWTDIVHDLGQRLCDINHQDYVIHCKRVEDIIGAHRRGKLAWVAVLESSSSIENEVDRIDMLYGLGIRSMGLTYSESNMLGSGLNEMKDGGWVARYANEIGVTTANFRPWDIDFDSLGRIYIANNNTTFNTIIRMINILIRTHVCFINSFW